MSWSATGERLLTFYLYYSAGMLITGAVIGFAMRGRDVWPHWREILISLAAWWAALPCAVAWIVMAEVAARLPNKKDRF